MHTHVRRPVQRLRGHPASTSHLSVGIGPGAFFFLISSHAQTPSPGGPGPHLSSPRFHSYLPTASRLLRHSLQTRNHTSARANFLKRTSGHITPCSTPSPGLQAPSPSGSTPTSRTWLTQPGPGRVTHACFSHAAPSAKAPSGQPVVLITSKPLVSVTSSGSPPGPLSATSASISLLQSHVSRVSVPWPGSGGGAVAAQLCPRIQPSAATELGLQTCWLNIELHKIKHETLRILINMGHYVTVAETGNQTVPASSSRRRTGRRHRGIFVNGSSSHAQGHGYNRWARRWGREGARKGESYPKS